LGAVEQGDEETYVYAEQLCHPTTLERFRQDLSPWLNWEHVEIFRKSLVRV
jgi:hypothetical protein